MVSVGVVLTEEESDDTTRVGGRTVGPTLIVQSITSRTGTLSKNLRSEGSKESSISLVL